MAETLSKKHPVKHTHKKNATPQNQGEISAEFGVTDVTWSHEHVILLTVADVSRVHVRLRKCFALQIDFVPQNVSPHPNAKL